MPAPVPDELRERYPFICPGCGKELSAAPCILMQLGCNSGHGTCTDCGLFIHLEIDEAGESMIAVPWDDYLAGRDLTPAPSDKCPTGAQ